MHVLLCPVVINHPGSGHIRAAALGRAEAHARRHFDADLGSRVGKESRLLNRGITYKRIHVPIGAVHGEGAANAHLGLGARFQGVFDARTAQGDGAEEIRSGGGDGNRIHQAL